MRYRFNIADLLILAVFASLFIDGYAQRSPMVFYLNMNLIFVTLFFAKPLAERLAIHSRLLLFPTTVIEAIVVIAILACLNLLMWTPANIQ